MLGIYYYLVNLTWKRITLSAVILFAGNLIRPEGTVIFCAIVLYHSFFLSVFYGEKNLKTTLFFLATGRFKKYLKIIMKRGYNIKLLQDVVSLLAAGIPLAGKKQRP